MTRKHLTSTTHALTDDGLMPVPANIEGGLAIHPWLDRNSIAEDVYAVTHVGSGMRITPAPLRIQAAARVRAAVAPLIDWTRPTQEEIYRQIADGGVPVLRTIKEASK